MHGMDVKNVQTIVLFKVHIHGALPVMDILSEAQTI